MLKPIAAFCTELNFNTDLNYSQEMAPQIKGCKRLDLITFEQNWVVWIAELLSQEF
jgi:hypothetical protein